MKRVALILGFLCCLFVWAAPAHAQRDKHWSGGGAFSPDGSLLAFYVQGRPANELIVIEVSSGRSFQFELPAPHAELEDLSWAQSGSTLLFVSLDTDSIESILPDPTINGGFGSHVWSITFTAEGPQPAKVIGRGQGVRRPALSADGMRVAYFQGVLLPREEANRKLIPPSAYAVFERDLATGEVVRVANSQYDRPSKLFYDGKDAWLFSAGDPKYRNTARGLEYWGSRQAPPGKGTFDQLTDGIKSFRMLRGEVLPEYPDHVRPYPPNAPPGSALVTMTTDGRPILFGMPGETAARQQLRSVLGNVPELNRTEMKSGYIVFNTDGVAETYFAPDPPGEFHWDNGAANTGGNGVDGTLKRYFIVQKPYAKDGSSEDYYRTSRLFLFEQQALTIQRDVRDILAKATKIPIAE